MRSRSGLQADGQSGAGKGCLTIFFLFFLLMGGAFTIVIIGETVRETAVWFWPATPCTIHEIGVATTDDDSEPYRPAVRFSYEVDGRTYEGHRVTRNQNTSSSFDKARRPSERYLPGSSATCRVNPDIPSDAVLERRLPWTGLIVFFPLIFVAIGGGGIWAVWKGSPSFESSAGGESISRRARKAKGLGRKVKLGVGLIFTAVGGGLSVFLLILPVTRLLTAVSWVETPATIREATVRSWSTDDGTSHRADILYEYHAEGRGWISNRRSFFPMGSSDYADSRALVDRYPKSSTTTCFVDPDDPAKSVLDRDFHPVYLIGLFPLLFLLAGAGLTAHALRSKPTQEMPRAASGNDPPEVYEPERTLEPQAGPIAKVVGMIFISAFWNGIVSVFVWQAVKAWRSGSPEWFLMIFLIPFVLVGLGLIAGIFYTALAAFNPRPTLTISPAAPRLGARLRVEWSFRGQVSRINHLKIVLEGFEKATYQRGTDTHTDRETFASLPLVDTSNDWEISQGTTDIVIPEDTMHSFAGSSNAIVWSLYFHGEIRRWPDVTESFEIEIRPLPAERLLP